MPDPGSPPGLILVRSAHDIGSAVAHVLKRTGYAPVLQETTAPGATRKLMSFAGAVHEGEAELERVKAVRCDAAGDVPALAGRDGVIPLWVADWDAPAPWPLAALVDARMRKKQQPPVQIDLAPLTIGIGPGFEAGVHTHVVIESNWGDDLGKVIREGTAQTYTGVHREVEGFGAQRYIYAPAGGVFTTERRLLDPVRSGETVGVVRGGSGAHELRVEIDGCLRGLATSGLQVEAGAKLVEVDPSGDSANCRGIGSRPARIAEGVLEAVRDVLSPGPGV